MRPGANLEVYIEELVLHGFELRDRYHIGEAVESELTRLFAEQGVPTSLTKSDEIARLDGRAFEVAEGTKAKAIGTQVAHSVYGGLGR